MPPNTVDEDLPQPFKAERGASQGAILSPATWLAFFDILLVALSSPGKKDNILPGLPGKLIYTHNPAYVEDIITPSATLESLQMNADIISAFCIIFGVDITIQRLRSYLANWSSVSIPINQTLLVHRGDWTAHPVSIRLREYTAS